MRKLLTGPLFPILGVLFLAAWICFRPPTPPQALKTQSVLVAAPAEASPAKSDHPGFHLTGPDFAIFAIIAGLVVCGYCKQTGKPLRLGPLRIDF